MSAKMREKRPTVAVAAGTCIPQPVIATNKPDHLERDRLPAHVRSADDRHPDLVVEPDRLRHRALVEQRVAAVEHVDRRRVDELRLDRVHPLGDRGARVREIELDVDRDVGADLRRFRADQRAQLGQDPRDLVLFLRAQRADAVVGLERFERLDEERLPARARVVDDPRKLAGELGLDRDDEAAVAHGHDRILDRARIARRARERGRPVARVVVACASARRVRASAGEARSSTVPRSSIASVIARDDRGSGRNADGGVAQHRQLGIRLADRAHGGA